MEFHQSREFDSLLQILRTRDLDAAEWLRLEELAGNDAFLVDAVEGLRSVPHEVRTKHLDSIQERLAKVTPAKRRSIILPVWLSAAAVVLLVVGVFWVIRPWSFSGDEQFAHDTSVNTYEETRPDPPMQEDMAMHKYLDTTPSIAQSRSAGAEEPGLSDAGDSRTLRETEQDRPAGEDAKDAKDAEAPRPEVAVSEPDVTAKSEAAAEMDEVRRVIGGNEVQTLSARPAFVTPEVKGVVLDKHGSPLYGVDVQLKGTVMVTQTDFQGNFAMDIPERHRQNALVFSYKDYPTLEASVTEGDSLLVRLQDEASSPEKAVTTFAQGKSKMQRPVTRSMARPAAGEKSYAKYIRQNLKYPEAAAAAGIHGKVVLEFDVATDGTPHNFRVIQSLGYGCDEEAIRLIREGPEWDAQSAQVSIGRWEIEF